MWEGVQQACWCRAVPSRPEHRCLPLAGLSCVVRQITHPPIHLPTHPPPPTQHPAPAAAGQRLQEEQELVNSIRLSGEYLKKQSKIGRSLIGLSG